MCGFVVIICHPTISKTNYIYTITHHHEQHSYPTRRSSDLTAYALRKRGFEVTVIDRLRYPAMDTSFAGRSEEHTSELQSRGQLVCRLMLEKKNKHCYR